ncbi:serine-rich adhesin for platelets-like [Haliotis cracherodii]|uniref:serine-rich adhesin for platelets-like n=1 Tax=Haliotis cracherodii TaxID=6455 RepID=UPI0039ECDEA5
MSAGAAREASIVSYVDNQSYTQMASHYSGASISLGSTNGGHPLKNDMVISMIGDNVGVCQNPETEFHTLRLDENGVLNFDANSCQIVQHGCPPEKQVPNGLSNICNGSSESVAGTVSLRRGQVCADRSENMASDTDLLASGSNRLEDRISEKYDHGPTSNTAGDLSGKNRSGHFKVCSQNQQNAVKEKGMLVSHTTPTIALVPDRDSSNTFMLKINNGPIVVRSRQKQKRREYSLYNVPMPGTFISTVSQTSKPPQTKVDCVKSTTVNPTASSRYPYNVHGKAGSEVGTSCLNTFQNNELAQTNTLCGRRITLPKSRLSVPSSGDGGVNDTTDNANSDSQCPVFVNYDLTQKHGDCQTRTVLSVSHHQQPVMEHVADGLILTAPAEPIPCGDHTEKGRLLQIDVAPRVETKEVQEEVLKPYCDCQMSTFTEDMAKACTISYQGLPVRLPHVSSVIIREHQLASFSRNGKLYVSVSELKSKNMIHNFTRFSSLLRSQSRLLPLAKTEVEFLKQRGRVKDSKNARLVSLDHLRWIYRTQAAQQQDAFNTAVSQCPWYSLALGHSCPKVSKLNQTQDYVCPLCLRVEQRPIEATTQRYECALCFQANESPSVPQPQITKVNNYVNKTKKMEQTSFMVREDGKMQNVKVGHIKVAEKNVAAFCKGDVSYVNCRHLVVHLYQFPWENFVSLVKSLDLCFMEAPLPVCHFFQRRAYPPELVNGRVWCSVQNLRCIACFSVGQMNNTQYLEKNKVLALIAQGKYVEEFLGDDKGGETEKILTEPNRALPSCEYQVHNSQVRTTNSSATQVRETPPDQMVVKIDATTGQILVCRGRVKGDGNLNLSQTLAQSRTRTDDQTGLNFDANGGQRVVGGGGFINSGNPSQTQTLVQRRTEQMGVNLDASSQIVVEGDTTTYAKPSNSVLQSRSLLTRRNSVERRPAVPAKTVFCCEMSQIPGGNYFAKENINFTDYESESGLVFRVMKQPTVAQNRVDILSIAAEEIRDVAYTSPYTTDLDKTGLSDPIGSICNQSFQASSFEQCSNLQQLMSEQKTQPQVVPGLDVTTNVTTVCKDVRTVEPTLVSSSDMQDNNHVSDGQENLLSMPVDFFQDSLGSPKRKHFLSPSKMGHVTKPGGEVIMVQSESGERYECTALCLIDELKDCMLVVSPVKEKKENQNVTPPCGVNLMDSLKTISPYSACSEKSVDSGISEGRSELCTPVERGSPISLNQSQKGLTVSQVDSLTNAEQSGSGNHSQACSVESAKNIESMTQQTSGVTPLVDEADRTEQTSGVTPLVDEADRIEQTSGVTPLVDEANRTEQTSGVTPLVHEADNREPTPGGTPLVDEADNTEPTPGVTPLVDEADRTEPTPGVTPLVDETDNTDTSGVGLEHLICFNMSQSSETNEAEPSNTSLTKSLDTPFSSPTRLSITSPSVISPVITNIYKKLVTHGHLDKSNSPSSLSVLASVAEAIDDDVGGEEDGTEGDSCKVRPVTGDNQPRNDLGSVVPGDDSSMDGGLNVSEEATGADTEEDSSPLLMETQSNSDEDEAIDSDTEVEASRLLQATQINSDTSAEGEASGGDTEEDSPLLQATQSISDTSAEGEDSGGDTEEDSPLLQATQINSDTSAEGEASGGDTEEDSPLLQATQSISDTSAEGEASGGDTEEDSPLLQATQNTSNTPAEDKAMGSDTFGSVCSGGSQSSSDTQVDNDLTNGGCKPTVLQDPGDLIVPNKYNHPAICVQGDKLAKHNSDKSSNSNFHNTCGHGERLSASDTDYSSSSGLPHGGEDGSPGTSNNSIEKEIEIFAELDLQLQTFIQNQNGRKFSAASEKQPKRSEDLNKCVAQKDDTKMQMVKVLERSPPLRHHKPGKRNPLCQETEVKEAESAGRSDAKVKDDLEIVTNESCHQHQTSERIKETDPGISLLVKDETKGTDLCNGGSVEPDEAVERKTKKRKRSQSVHKGDKRKKEEMEQVIKGLGATSNHPSSKSKNILRIAETTTFSEGDESQQKAVEAAVFSENTANEFVATKSPKFSEGDGKDHTETLNSSECATKGDIEGERSRDAGEEGLTDHAVEKMKRVLEMVQVDGLVVAPDRLRFNLNLRPSLHKHFKGETQKELVDKLSRLVKIGYILQQRRQKADGEEQTPTSVES